MTEATGCEAQTIHRLLEVSGNPDDETIGGFQRNAENPLEADVVIIDEMSMVDLPLMYALLNAIVPGTRVILVGGCEPASKCRTGKCTERYHFFGVLFGCKTDEDIQTGRRK